jgi:hypothetical protein
MLGASPKHAVSIDQALLADAIPEPQSSLHSPSKPKKNHSLPSKRSSGTPVPSSNDEEERTPPQNAETKPRGVIHYSNYLHPSYYELTTPPSTSFLPSAKILSEKIPTTGI